MKSIYKLKKHFKLPGNPGDTHIIPLSGGIDSTALAVIMRTLFPETEFIYVFTDTRAETPEIYEVLNKLEQVMDIKITRLIPDKGLIEMCKTYGGYLPGYNSRWCTKELKAKPFHGWLKQFRNQGTGIVHAYVGIRADEDRTGLISQEDFIEQHMPLKEMGIKREDVFNIVKQSGLEIPGFYRIRSRSGCTCCPYSRLSESIGSMRRHPALFYEGELIEVEKLNQDDKHRWHNQAVNVTDEASIGLNHLGYPIPRRIDASTTVQSKAVNWIPSKRKTEHDTLNLFAYTEIWVLVEFMVHAGVGDHGVWWQDIVTYSRTRGGLAKQAKNFWWHRVMTAPVMGISSEEMKNELKLAVYRIHFPEGKVDIEPPGDGSYTWKSGVSYRQIRHIVGHIQRTLQVEGIKQLIEQYRHAKPGSWSEEYRIGLENALHNIKEPIGEILGMDLIEIECDEEPEEDEKEIACFACSL